MLEMLSLLSRCSDMEKGHFIGNNVNDERTTAISINKKNHVTTLTAVGKKQNWSAFGCENVNNNHHHRSYATCHKWNSCLDKTDKSSTMASSL
jgi:hypothetical protein